MSATATPVPEDLYKYRSLQTEADRKYTREIIVDSKLFFPSPLQFNDPFDAVPAIVMSGDRAARKRRIRDLVARNERLLPGLKRKEAAALIRGMNVSQLEAAGRHALRETLAEIGLCSMSARNDHVLMWSHYAAAHTGICIGFKPHPFDELSAVCRAFEVTYSAERPKHNPLSEMTPGSAFDLMLRKADFWRYEEEWRLVRRNPHSGPGHEPFDPRRLTSITFGTKTPPERVDEVMRWVKERPQPVKFYRAVPDDLTYRLTIRPYSTA